MTRLQLHLSARGLKNLSGLMGMSDPFAIVTVRGDSENNRPQVVGQTDVYVPLLASQDFSRASSLFLFFLPPSLLLSLLLAYSTI